MKKVIPLVIIALTALPGFVVFGNSQRGIDIAKPSMVLVHGAFADGSSWRNVIRILQRDGFFVTAVQIGENSLAEDIATTQRVLDAQKGPVILVGHSYGGAVITGAAVDHSNVKALVYVSAFAPDKNEPIGALLGRFPPTLLATALVPDAAGFLYINRTLFREVFAADVNSVDADIMAATQRPINSAIFGQSVTDAAWKTIPSWFLVTTKDNAVNPDLQRFEAQRMHATTVEFSGSHATIVSHPKVVTDLIEQAAQSVEGNGDVHAEETLAPTTV